MHGNVICNNSPYKIVTATFFFYWNHLLDDCRATGSIINQSAFTVSYTRYLHYPGSNAMTWFQKQDGEFKYGLIKSVPPYETPGSDAASVKHPNGCWGESGLGPGTTRWNRLESGAPVISSSSGLGFSFQGSLHWDWKGGNGEKPSHNHLNDYVNIQMILFVDPMVCFGLGCLFTSAEYFCPNIINMD